MRRTIGHVTEIRDERIDRIEDDFQGFDSQALDGL